MILKKNSDKMFHILYITGKEMEVKRDEQKKRTDHGVEIIIPLHRGQTECQGDLAKVKVSPRHKLHILFCLFSNPSLLFHILLK